MTVESNRESVDRRLASEIQRSIGVNVSQQLLASALTVMVATFGEDHSRSQKVQRFLDELAAERRRSPPRSHAAS